jgi:amino acid transporter
MKERYKINEYGEIIREDYFFRQVHGIGVQILPFERKVWKIFLISLIPVFGWFYGLFLTFFMARETNISCAEDGGHTRNFWAATGLSIITLGIYGLVWQYKWYDREAKYLKRHNKKSLLTGGQWLALFVFGFILSYVVIGVVFFFIIFCKQIWQHNKVNATYNEINNFVSKV